MVAHVSQSSIIITKKEKAVVKGIHTAGVFSSGLSTRHTGVLMSPRFVLNSNSISVRALGSNARVRLVIENYPLGNGGIFPARPLDRDQFGWHVLNSKYRIGQHAHLEFVTNMVDRAHFAVDRIVTGDALQPPAASTVPISFLLEDEAPASVGQLVDRYVGRLRQTVRSWQSGTANENEVAFLDFFVRRGLLPVTLSKLPHLDEAIKRFRRLEHQLRVPRRAPGVLETVAYNQPLFESGRHTQPAHAVPRRGLSLFGDEPFRTTDSGRLQLAEQTAAATNP